MGLFDRFKKPSAPEQVNEAAMLFCPEPDPKKVLDQVEELFQITRIGDQTICSGPPASATCPNRCDC